MRFLKCTWFCCSSGKLLFQTKRVSIQHYFCIDNNSWRDNSLSVYIPITNNSTLYNGTFSIEFYLYIFSWFGYTSCLDIEFIVLDLTIEFSVRRRYFFHNCSDKYVASWIWYSTTSSDISYWTSRPEYKYRYITRTQTFNGVCE